MTFSSGLGDVVFYIEVRELPAIFDSFKENGYFIKNKNRSLSISRISSQGIVLYFVKLPVTNTEKDENDFTPKDGYFYS